MKTKNIRTNLIPSSIDKENKTIDFIMTAEVADRDGDIVDIDTIQLDNFLLNPVVLPSHNNKEKVVGRVIEIKKEVVEGIKALIGKVQFAVGLTTEADEYWNLYSEGFQNAVSIGFNSPRGEETKDGFRMFDSELLELSLVSIPANQLALAKSARKVSESCNGDFENIQKSAKEFIIGLKTIFEDKIEDTEKEDIKISSISDKTIRKAEMNLRRISQLNKAIRSLNK
jgi:phage head maturation protease